jgi:hypothetical protein
MVAKMNGSVAVLDLPRRRYHLRTNLLDFLNANNPLSQNEAKLQELAAGGSALSIYLDSHNNTFVEFLGNCFLFNRFLEEWTAVDRSQVNEETDLVTWLGSTVSVGKADGLEGLNLILVEVEGPNTIKNLESIEENLNFAIYIEDFSLFLNLLGQYVEKLVCCGEVAKVEELVAKLAGHASSRESAMFVRHRFDKGQFLHRVAFLLPEGAEWTHLRHRLVRLGESN